MKGIGCVFYTFFERGTVMFATKKSYTVADIDKDLEKIRKKEERRRKAKETMKKVGKFVTENWEMIVIFSPVIIAAGTGLVRTSGRVVKGIVDNVTLTREKNIKKFYCYDRSLGHYWALRRNLTNAEWVQIDKRKAAGERLGDILADLKVLK